MSRACSDEQGTCTHSHRGGVGKYNQGGRRAAREEKVEITYDFHNILYGMPCNDACARIDDMYHESKGHGRSSGRHQPSRAIIQEKGGQAQRPGSKGGEAHSFLVDIYNYDISACSEIHLHAWSGGQ